MGKRKQWNTCVVHVGDLRQLHHASRVVCLEPGLFSFLYLKKSKFQKYMSILKNLKNTPGRPMGATGPSCNFFSSNLQRGP